MNTLIVSLPDSVQEFVQRQVEEGGYATPSEYIVALIGEAQKRKAKEKVEALLLEGLNSGPASEMTAQDWEDIRQEVRQQRQAREKVENLLLEGLQSGEPIEVNPQYWEEKRRRFANGPFNQAEWA